MAASSLNWLETLCEKEKLLITSNFSFSHSVFKRLVRQTRENQGLFGKGLIDQNCYYSKQLFYPLPDDIKMFNCKEQINPFLHKYSF